MLILYSHYTHTILTLYSDIIKVLESDFNGFVVVDEAYVDFAGKEASVSQLVHKYPQLVVMQTMSKGE
jgi:histidinol-phosphate aminotransferase